MKSPDKVQDVNIKLSVDYDPNRILGGTTRGWIAGIIVFLLIGELCFKGEVNRGIPIMVATGLATVFLMSKLGKKGQSDSRIRTESLFDYVEALRPKGSCSFNDEDYYPWWRGSVLTLLLVAPSLIFCSDLLGAKAFIDEFSNYIIVGYTLSCIVGMFIMVFDDQRIRKKPQFLCNFPKWAMHFSNSRESRYVDLLLKGEFELLRNVVIACLQRDVRLVGTSRFIWPRISTNLVWLCISQAYCKEAHDNIRVIEFLKEKGGSVSGSNVILILTEFISYKSSEDDFYSNPKAGVLAEQLLKSLNSPFRCWMVRNFTTPESYLIQVVGFGELADYFRLSGQNENFSMAQKQFYDFSRPIMTMPLIQPLKSW